MLRIAIIIGCTRPARVGAAVGGWAYEIARKRRDADFELLDLATVDLPLLDEPKAKQLGSQRATKIEGGSLACRIT